MSENQNGQDLGQQLADASSKALNNKQVRRGARKAVKFIAKLTASFIKKLIAVIVKTIVWFIGPWGLAILLAIILMLSVLNAVKEKFDWFSFGGDRTEVQELFDNTLKETLEKKHKSIASPLSSELEYPSSVLSGLEGVKDADVDTDNVWKAHIIDELTPSWAITAGAYFNYIQRKGDNWHKDFKGLDPKKSSTKQKMVDSINKEFKYYFDDSQLKLNVTRQTEKGEEVTTRKVSVCTIKEPVTDVIETEKKVKKTRWVQKDVEVTKIQLCPPPNPWMDMCIVKTTEKQWVLEEYWDTVIEREEVTEYITKTETKETGPTTSKLKSRQIPTQASTLYASVTIPYKYITIPERKVSEKTEGDCVVTTYKKYKLKVVDDSAPAMAQTNPASITSFLTASMPEGKKTTLVRQKDIDYISELIGNLDPTVPGFTTVDGGGGGGGGIGGGTPGFEVPLTSGTFTAPTTGRVTSGFGPRWGRLHSGVDVGGGGRSNVPIVAAADGVVTVSEYHARIYGERIIIEHNIDGKTWTTCYWHMAPGTRQFKKGDKVKKGDFIGILGTTGDSTGPHLHFEIHPSKRPGESQRTAVNPLLYVTIPPK